MHTFIFYFSSISAHAKCLLLSGKFISTLLLSLTAMLHLGLPHVNLLSKMDVMHQYKDQLLFGIDFYTDVLDLHYLLEALDEDPFSKK